MEKVDREAIERARALLNKKYNSVTSPSMLLAIQHGAFEGYADHAEILVAVSIIEQLLEENICGFLIDDEKVRTRMFRGDMDCPGPLGSFWSKIQIARALGAIGPKTLEGLDKLRHIRNLFAHAKEPISFETSEIVGLCNFSTDDGDYWGGLMGDKPTTAKGKAFGFMQMVSLALLPVENGSKRWEEKFLARWVG